MLFAALLMMGQAVTDEPGLAPVPENAKISADRPLIGVTAALDEIGRATGVEFRVDPELAGLRVALLYQDQNAREVLRHLADVLEAQWRTDGRYVRLRIDAKLWAQRQEYRAKRAAANRAQLERVLRGMAEQARRSRSELKADLENTERTIASMNGPGGPPRSPEYDRLVFHQSVLNEMSDPRKHANAALMAGWTESTWRRFWDGEVLWAAPGGGSAGELLPTSNSWRHFFEMDRPLTEADTWRPEPPKLVLFRFDSHTGAMRQRTFTWSEGSMSSTSDGIAGGHAVPFDHPYRKYWSIWSDARMDLTVPMKSTQAWPSPWNNGLYSAGDHLRYFHRASGRPIVAAITREPHYWGGLAGHGATVGEYLTAWRNSGGGFFKDRGEFLLYRPNGYSDAIHDEPSEVTLSAFESIAKPGMVDYGRLALSILPLHRDFVANSQFLCRHDISPLADGFEALRIWGSLTEAERQTAINGGRVPYASMSPRAKKELENALATAMMSGGFASQAHVRLLRKGWDSGDEQRLALRVTTGNSSLSRLPARAGDADWNTPLESTSYPAMSIYLDAGEEVLYHVTVVNVEAIKSTGGSGK
jgi:hypothetical protein